MKKFVIVLCLFTAFQAFAQEDGWLTVTAQQCQDAGRVYDVKKRSTVVTSEFRFAMDASKAFKRTVAADGSLSEETFTLVNVGRNIYLTNPDSPDKSGDSAKVGELSEFSYFFVEVSDEGQAIRVYTREYDRDACGEGIVVSSLGRGDHS
jgi:hypothetical protein